MFCKAETSRLENKLIYHQNNGYDCLSPVSMHSACESLTKICWISGGFLRHQSNNKRIKEKSKYNNHCEWLIALLYLVRSWII